MFMEIAIGAIGIGIVLMLGYIVLSQVRAALPSAPQATYSNPCYGVVGTDLSAGTTCRNVSTAYYGVSVCSETNLASYNLTGHVSCSNVGYSTGLGSVQATAFAGFGLIAVGIIVLAAFGLINIFK